MFTTVLPGAEGVSVTSETAAAMPRRRSSRSDRKSELKLL